MECAIYFKFRFKQIKGFITFYSRGVFVLDITFCKCIVLVKL